MIYIYLSKYVHCGDCPRQPSHTMYTTIITNVILFYQKICRNCHITILTLMSYIPPGFGRSFPPPPNTLLPGGNDDPPTLRSLIFRGCLRKPPGFRNLNRRHSTHLERSLVADGCTLLVPGPWRRPRWWLLRQCQSRGHQTSGPEVSSPAMCSNVDKMWP